MYWTFELADHLNEAPWPATKRELLDFCHRSGAPVELITNIENLPDDEDIKYTGIEDLWPDQPDRMDYYNNDQEEEDPYY